MLISLVLVSCAKSQGTLLRIGYDSLETNVNPYLYTTKRQSDLISLTFMSLFPTDRAGEALYHASGNEGEVSNNDNEVYYSFADLSISSSYDYTIKLRDDLYSYSGRNIDSFDLMFSIYLLLDPSLSEYVESFDSSWQKSFQSLPIEGYQEYLEIVSSTSKSVTKQMKQEAYVSGISENVTNRSVTIKMTRELTPEELKLLNIYIVPYTQFSDGTTYSSSAHVYGFTKGDLSTIQFANVTLDSTGPYCLKTYNKDEMKYDKNSAYYLPVKTNKLELIRFREVKRDEDGYPESGGDIYFQIYHGWLDLSVINATEEQLKELTRYNVNDKLNGNYISFEYIKDHSYQMEDSTLGIVYSTKRVDSECIKKLYVSEHYSILKEVYKISTYK